MRRVLVLGCLLAGCARAEPEPPAEPAASSVRNEPVAVHVGGREVRVACEIRCAPLEEELGRLVESCRADALGAPHLVSIDGHALTGLGCCTQAEAAYREACGLEGELSACGSAWLARCQSEAS